MIKYVLEIGRNGMHDAGVHELDRAKGCSDSTPFQKPQKQINNYALSDPHT